MSMNESDEQSTTVNTVKPKERVGSSRNELKRDSLHAH